MYDARANPTTLDGLAEHMRVVMREEKFAGVYLPVFRQNRMTKDWERKKLLVWADTRYHGSEGKVTFHLAVVRTTKIEDGEEEDIFYKRDLLLVSHIDGVEPGLFDRYGHPTQKGWRRALRTLNVRMKRPTATPTAKPRTHALGGMR